MSYQQVSLNPKLLLAAVNENLNRHFYAGARDSSKALYKAIEQGVQAPFMRIDTGDSGEVFCELSLDSSLYVGNINFGKFRKSLAMMMLGIRTRTENDEPLNAMTSQSGEIMFNIPGIVNEGNQINVMVCSFQPMGPGLASVKLMYLDPDKYAAAAQKASDLVASEK
ncbi:MAG: hypothetical protein ACJAQ6_000921 [Arenicella sp.]|jgi:hypothetical protein